MDPEPSFSSIAFILVFLSAMMTTSVIVSLIVLILLVISSALMSGSEVAFFSLNQNNIIELQEEESPSSIRILKLLQRPKTLLATILISNNFVNIAIVIVSAFLIDELLSEEQLLAIGQYLYDVGLSSLASANSLAQLIGFLVTVVGVTFLLVLFGEIVPKIYANLNNMKFARFMSRPLGFLNTVFSPLSSILVSMSTKIEDRVRNSDSYQSSTSKEDLDAAIELTVTSEEPNSEEQADILKGIVKFGDVSTKQIMKSRVDMVAIEESLNFAEVLAIIKDSGYSRIPVYKEDLDNISGLLYAKDLIGYLDSDKSFNWIEFIRDNVLYVPESKRIDDLLREFQLKRTHMGIVVDEYGGSSGLVTLEDIMEEVVGDIKDEFDEDEEVEYVMLSEGNYIFEGKTLLNDVCRVAGLDNSYFDKIRGESDSIAGLILELTGIMPKVEKEIEYRDIKMKVVSVTKRRIEKINIRMI